MFLPEFLSLPGETIIAVDPYRLPRPRVKFADEEETLLQEKSLPSQKFYRTQSRKQPSQQSPIERAISPRSYITFMPAIFLTGQTIRRIIHYLRRNSTRTDRKHHRREKNSRDLLKHNTIFFIMRFSIINIQRYIEIYKAFFSITIH